MIKSTKRGPNFAQFTLLSIGTVLIKNTLGPLGVNELQTWLPSNGRISNEEKYNQSIIMEK
jgi:hypothetical protein